MRLVIIGNGVAGVTTARFVADQWPSEREDSVEITIYSGEPYPYYPRPRLIDLLSGTTTVDDLPQYSAAWYAERGIERALGTRVKALLPDEHLIVLEDGEHKPYDILVLATGAHPWRPPIPGIDLAGVHTLRCLDDTLAIRAEGQAWGNALILGGGLLGLDTAMALCAQGVGVTIVELQPWLLPRQLDAEGAEILVRSLERRGARVITGCSCTGLTPNSAMGEDPEPRVAKANLADADGCPETVSADMVIVSAGVRANTALAQQAEIACGRGVLVNERLETSAPGIYAVGDVAEYQGRVWGIIPAALAQARVAAAQIVGDRQRVYEGIVPSTTLQVTGIDLTSIGVVNPDGDGYVELRRVDREAETYKKVVLKDGKLVGAILLGTREGLGALRRLIDSDAEVSRIGYRLLDHDLDANSLLSEKPGQGM